MAFRNVRNTLSSCTVHITKLNNIWACSSAGRAFGSHPRGREFESLQVHQFAALDKIHVLRFFLLNFTEIRRRSGSESRAGGTREPLTTKARSTRRESNLFRSTMYEEVCKTDSTACNNSASGSSLVRETECGTGMPASCTRR